MSRTTHRAAISAAAIATLVTVAGTSFSSSAETGASAGNGLTAAGTTATRTGEVAFVQAVPAETVWVTVDGKMLEDAVKGGQVVGPVALEPGSHEVVFGGGDTAETSSSFEVTAGTSTDLVLHRPAQVGGTPVVSSYASPTEAIGPGKARVILAHTATTAPADVKVDGKTVFTNIANGEYAQADVAAGSHEVALFPSGVDAKAILGPVNVDLPAGTLTSVYAVGNPMDGSMNVVVRRSGLGAADTTAPTKIETGTAGLVGGLRVTTFGLPR